MLVCYRIVTEDCLKTAAKGVKWACRRLTIYVCMQANSYSSLPFTVRFTFVRSLLTWAALGPAKERQPFDPLPCRPFNSQSSGRGLRVGDVFINLKDPPPSRSAWTSDACPGDPGQSGRWIRQQFYPEKSRLEASEFNLLRIYFLNKGPRNWVEARVKR